MKPNKREPMVERLFEDFEPPQPPPGLRSKALDAARDRFAAEQSPDMWSRLWNHRGLRLAWAASVVLLLAAHVMTSSPGFGLPGTAEPALRADNRADEYLAGMLRPVRISENVLPIVGLMAATDSLAELDLQRNPS